MKEIVMGFDDLFKHRGHGGHHDDHHGYYYGGRPEGHRGHHGDLEQYLYLFEKLKNNKKLLMVVVAAALVVAIIGIAAIIMLVPVILNWLDIVQKGGIKGLIEMAGPLLERLWIGTGK